SLLDVAEEDGVVDVLERIDVAEAHLQSRAVAVGIGHRTAILAGALARGPRIYTVYTLALPSRDGRRNAMQLGVVGHERDLEARGERRVGGAPGRQPLAEPRGQCLHRRILELEADALKLGADAGQSVGRRAALRERAQGVGDEAARADDGER